MLHIGIQHGDFIAFSNIRGTAASYLHRIGDRRLFESQDSPHCMEILCNHIPENLPNEAQFQVTSYRMGCYQHFTRNLDCLNKGILWRRLCHVPQGSYMGILNSYFLQNHPSCCKPFNLRYLNHKKTE